MTLIRVIDLETTGTEPIDEVVEIGAVDVALNTHTKALERLDLFNTDKVRTTKPIPPAASAIHHLTDNDVKDAKLWDDTWPLYLTAEVGIYAAHNAKFEAQWLSEKMRQGAPFICTYKCALRIWPDAPNHKNQTLRYWLKSAIGNIDHTIANQPHRALPDAYVTAWVLVALLREATISDLIQWSKEPPLLPTCPIGKKRGWYGKKWSEIDEGSLKWMIREITDDPDLTWNVKRELSHRWNEDIARRNKYVEYAKQAIAEAQSRFDLTKWFVDSKRDHFPTYGITNDSAEYKIIVAACAERNAQFTQTQEQQNASAA